MKNFIKKLLSTSTEVSSKRLYAGLLIVSGIILAFFKGETGNVQTLVYAGVALLGAGAFAEGMQNKSTRDIEGGG